MNATSKKKIIKKIKKSKRKSPAKARKVKVAQPEIVKKVLKTKSKRKKTLKKANSHFIPSEIKSFVDPTAGESKYKIVLLVRDPFWLHSYWEIPQYKIDELRQDIKILRVYDVTGVTFTGLNANKSFDINLNENDRNWYVNVKESNRSWCVDLGYLTPEGRFYVAARSNIVSTPRSGISEIIDEEWMIVDWDKIYILSGGSDRGQSSAEIREIFSKRLSEEMPSC